MGFINSFMISKLISWLAKVLQWDMTSTDNITVIPIVNDAENGDLSVVAPKSTTIAPPPITAPIKANKPTLEAVATAMRDFEGGTNDANYRNNNPLNCKFFYGGYLPMYEPVKISPSGFAIFKDYATGWLYGCSMLKSKIKHHPQWTLLDMITDHAPPSDNNPSLIYAKTVAKRVGVDISYKVINLVYT